MLFHFEIRLAFAAVAIASVSSVAHGYIHFPPMTLQKGQKLPVDLIELKLIQDPLLLWSICAMIFPS